MADDRTPPEEQPEETPAPDEEVTSSAPAGEEEPAAAEQPAAEAPAEAEPPAAAKPPAEQPAAAKPPAEQSAAAEAPAEQPVAADAPAERPAAEAPVAEPAPADEVSPQGDPLAAEATADAATPSAPAATGDELEDDETPRAKPEIPGADLEVDIVEEGADPLARLDDDELAALAEEDELSADQPIAAVTIDLGAGARYRATGKRKTAIARVTLRPGTGAYTINGRELNVFFPRGTLQRNIRQPLEAVGYDDRMDVVARMQGGGVSAQAGALRHGISRALLEADPNLRGELKRRGFLTRDPRVKERKKAGLKKARKRPQFSKR